MLVQPSQSVPLLVKNVTICRGKHTVVDDCCLSMAVGDVLGLIGLNGAGKSTTLACLAGLIAPATGQIEIGGIDLLADPMQAKRLIGYLPDPPALHNELTVGHHLSAMAALLGITRPDRADAVTHAVEQTGLENALTKRIGHLSQGYRQRVGIAQALLHNPAVVLLDEPTNGLDMDQQAQFAETIEKIAQSAAVIISSHHMADIRSCCNRIAVLDSAALTIQPARSAERKAETVFVRLQQPVTPAELFGIPGICDVSAHGEGWLVTVLGDIADLSTHIADRRWGLMQLSPGEAVQDSVRHNQPAKAATQVAQAEIAS